MNQNPVSSAFEQIDARASSEFRESLRTQLLAGLVARMSSDTYPPQDTLVTYTNADSPTVSRGRRTLLGIAAVLIVAVGATAVVINRNSAHTNVAGDSLPAEPTAAPTTIPFSQPVTITGETLSMFVPKSAIDPEIPSDEVDPEIGQPAPLISGFDFQGNSISVDPAVNGPYMIVFLAHWCPHCNVEVPRLLEWKASGDAPIELNVLGVSTAASPTSPDFPPDVWFASRSWTWPVMVDESQGDGNSGKAASAYGAWGWPFFVIIGADGLMKARFAGEPTVSELQTIVDQALAAVGP